MESSIHAASPGSSDALPFLEIHPFYSNRELQLLVSVPSAYEALSFDTHGCQVTGTCRTGDNITVSVVLASEECYLTVWAAKGGKAKSASAYFFKAGGGWYASSLSLASAKTAYYDYAFKIGDINEAEHSRLVSAARLAAEDPVPSFGPIIPPPPVSLYDYFYPSLTWTDGNGNEQPLAYVTVELYKIVDGTRTKLNSAITDGNGEATLKTLSVLAADADSFSIDVIAQNDQVQLSQGGGDGHSLYSFSIINVAKNQSIEWNLAADSEANHMFQLFEIGAYCSLFGQNVAGDRALHLVTIAYSDSYSNASFIIENNQDRIIRVDPYHSSGSSSIFTHEDWDTIAHEYGHFLSYELGWAVLNDDGIEHSDEDNMIDAFSGMTMYSDAPEKGLEFAWSEGLATYLGQAALRFNSDALSTVPLANDRAYTSANGHSYSLDGYGYSYGGLSITPKGAGNEYAISQLLYKMADSHTDQYDSLGVGDGTILSMLDHLGASKTAGGFVDVALDTLDDDDAFALGKLLERLDFSPKNLDVSFLFGRPAFSWEGTGGSATHPFVSFYLTVYDEDLRPIYAISSHDSNSWSPSSSTWGTIVGDAGGGPIYLEVAGRTDLEYRHFPSSLLEVETQ